MGGRGLGQLPNILGRGEQAWWLWFLGPDLVGAARERLIGAEIFRGNVGEDEVLGRDRASGEAAKKGELASVGHGVGEGALQEDLCGDAVEWSAEFDVARYVGEDFVEVRDGGGEVRQRGWLIGTAEEVRAGVPE